jgi:hypothetical protein
MLRVGSRWKRLASFTSGQRTGRQLFRRLGGSYSPSGCGHTRKRPAFPTGNWTPVSQPIASHYIDELYCLMQILERFQLKALCKIVEAPWYVPNTVIRRDLQIPTVTEEIRRYSSQYSARLSAHPNDLTVNLMSYHTTGDCEDTCQMICLPDSWRNCCNCNSSL